MNWVKVILKRAKSLKFQDILSEKKKIRALNTSKKKDNIKNFKEENNFNEGRMQKIIMMIIIIQKKKKKNEI